MNLDEAVVRFPPGTEMAMYRAFLCILSEKGMRITRIETYMQANGLMFGFIQYMKGTVP